MPIINPKNIDLGKLVGTKDICLSKALDVLVPKYPYYEFHIKRNPQTNKVAEVRYMNELLGEVTMSWSTRFGRTYCLTNPRIAKENWRKGKYETADLNKLLTKFRRTMLPRSPEQVMVGASSTIRRKLAEFKQEVTDIYGRTITEAMYNLYPSDKVVVDTLELIDSLLAGSVADKVLEKTKTIFALSHSLITAYDANNYILIQPRGKQLFIQLRGDEKTLVRERIKNEAVNTKFALLKVLDPNTMVADVGIFFQNHLGENLFFITTDLNDGDLVI